MQQLWMFSDLSVGNIPAFDKAKVNVYQRSYMGNA